MVFPRLDNVNLNFAEHERHPRIAKRFLVAAVIISTITTLGMILTAMDIQGVRGISFSRAFKAQWINFTNFFTHMAGAKAFPFVCSIIGALILGGGALLLSISKRGARIAARVNDKGEIERLVERKPGNYTSTDHYRRVEIRVGKGREIAYIDYSGLDEKGKGLAPIYAYQAPIQNETVGILVVPGAVIRATLSMVCNALLVVPLFFYYLGGWAYETCTGKYIFSEEQRFKKEYIVLQPCAAMWEVVRAPFYAVAVVMSGGIYASLINPLNGRILQSRVEEEWNFNPFANASTPLNRGAGILTGASPHFKVLGRGLPTHVNANSLYVAPCRHVLGYVEKEENGKIIAVWDSGFTNPNKFSIVIEQREGDEYSRERSVHESADRVVDASNHPAQLHDPNEYFIIQSQKI